jgi:hypothetical protein
MSKQDSSSIESRLAKYGAMSIAVASGVLAMPAQAGIITTSASTACPGNNSTTGGVVYFNPVAGTCGHASAGALFKIENITGFSGTAVLQAVGMTSHALLAGDGNFLTRLATNGTPGFSAGLFLGGALELKSSGGAQSGNWTSGDTDYIGLLMNATGYHYGWAQVQITGYNATLLQFAYNDGVGIPPGTGSDAPEPSSMALLALGAAGLVAYRRKKTKAA